MPSSYFRQALEEPKSEAGDGTRTTDPDGTAAQADDWVNLPETKLKDLPLVAFLHNIIAGDPHMIVLNDAKHTTESNGHTAERPITEYRTRVSFALWRAEHGEMPDKGVQETQSALLSYPWMHHVMEQSEDHPDETVIHFEDLLTDGNSFEVYTRPGTNTFDFRKIDKTGEDVDGDLTDAQERLSHVDPGKISILRLTRYHDTENSGWKANPAHQSGV